MKVLLLNPPTLENTGFIREGRCTQEMGVWTTIWPPLSLAQTASLLRKTGIGVKLHDCGVEGIGLEKLEEITKDYAPDIVVLSVATPTIESDLKVVTRIKKIRPEVLTCIFGTHPTVLPDECFALSPELDVVIRGEPEISLEDLVSTISRSAPLSEVKGITFRSGDRVIHNPPRPFLEDLDALGPPAWDLVDKDKYRLPFTGEKFLLFAPSRGCPYLCTFCTASVYYGKKVRKRSPKKVVDELEWVISEHGVRNFLAWSETFTVNRQYVLDIAGELISRNLDIRWVCNSRVDTVDRELLDTLRRAGCWMMSYGIESASQGILDRAGKKTTPQQAERAVEMARDARLEVTGHFILGLPGETKESIKDTIKFARDLDLDFAQFYCAVPFPGSQLFAEAQKNKWINTNDWARFEQHSSALNTKNLKAEEVMAFRREAYRRFYLRPQVIFRTLKRIKSLRELKNFIHIVKNFLTWI
jgi:radical SAM superfamily enzyme YgiQ (UPF0313 family)